MLKRLLELIAGGVYHTLEDLAAALEVSPILLTQMVRKLLVMGYLQRSGECATGCTSCALKSACGSKPVIVLWVLTDKGRDFVSPSAI